MRGISLGTTISGRRSSFQAFEVGSSKSITRRAGLKEGPQGVAGRAGVVGSQGSAQTRVLCPIPIIYEGLL